MWVGSIPALSTPAIATIFLLMVADGKKWDIKCTAPCTCDMSYFSDLSMATQWQGQETTPKQIPNNTNEATYDENEQPRGDILKIAMCVLQEGTNPQAVIESLPKDIQVLTILQGRGYLEPSLEAVYFQDFPDLVVIDIQGFKQEDSKSTDRLVLRNDIFQPVTSLKYLNLENIKLLGHTGQDNVIHPMKLPQLTGSVLRNSRKGRRDKDTAKRRIVFLQPTDNDIPLVSYEEYRHEIERAGLTTFTGLSELLSLRVYACDLREVNWEMFKGLGKLQHLSLERNNLLFIPEFAFYGTPHLKTLSLAGNKLLSLQDTALAGLLELNKLDLSGNKFSHLSELSLPPFPELRTADFRNNPVEAIFPSTFEIMNATYELYLGGDDSPLNLLPNSFLGLSSLKKLHISNVKVPLFERELLREMPKLQKLEMTGNIHTLSFDAFLEVPKLENLLLKNCNISAISMDAFYGLYGLISLDLSYNLLTWLPPGVFDQQFSLRELLLNNNQLTKLPPSIFTRVPAKMIRLDHNPWHCSCAMSEWQPSAINKIKQRVLKQDGLCQFSYDKGSHCKGMVADRYVYDKRVAPRCATPQKFSNWNVFHLLRKELHCTKKQKKEYMPYLKRKQEDYELSVNPQQILTKYHTIEQILEGNINKPQPETAFNINSKIKSNVPPRPSEIGETNFNSLQETPVATDSLSPKIGDINQLVQKDDVETTTEEGGVTHTTTTAYAEETIDTQKSDLNVSQSNLAKQEKNSTLSNTGSTTVTTQSSKIKTNGKIVRAGDISISKKAKQQLALQREREEKAAWKDKIKTEMSNNAVKEGLNTNKELKNTLKLEIQKIRVEKLKQTTLQNE